MWLELNPDFYKYEQDIKETSEKFADCLEQAKTLRDDFLDVSNGKKAVEHHISKQAETVASALTMVINTIESQQSQQQQIDVLKKNF